MTAESSPIDVGNPFFQNSEDISKLIRHTITNCVRDIDGCGALVDGGLHDLAEVIQIAAACILSRKFDVIAQRFCQTNRLSSLLQNLLSSTLQLVLKMNVRSGNKGVNPWPVRILQGFPGPANVQLYSTRQARDGHGSNLLGNLSYGFKVSV